MIRMVSENAASTVCFCIFLCFNPLFSVQICRVFFYCASKSSWVWMTSDSNKPCSIGKITRRSRGSETISDFKDSVLHPDRGVHFRDHEVVIMKRSVRRCNRQQRLSHCWFIESLFRNCLTLRTSVSDFFFKSYRMDVQLVSQTWSEFPF